MSYKGDIYMYMFYQAEDDAKAKDKELSEALERMRQYEAVSTTYIVKSTYKEPAYKELPVIRNWILFPNLTQVTSSPYVYKNSSYKELIFMVWWVPYWYKWILQYIMYFQISVLPGTISEKKYFGKFCVLL